MCPIKRLASPVLSWKRSKNVGLKGFQLLDCLGLPHVSGQPCSAHMVVSNQFNSLAHLETTPGAHWKGSWADPRVTLNALEKSQITCPSQQLKTLKMIPMFICHIWLDLSQEQGQNPSIKQVTDASITANNINLKELQYLLSVEMSQKIHHEWKFLSMNLSL